MLQTFEISKSKLADSYTEIIRNYLGTQSLIHNTLCESSESKIRCEFVNEAQTYDYLDLLNTLLGIIHPFLVTSENEIVQDEVDKLNCDLRLFLNYSIDMEKEEDTEKEVGSLTRLFSLVTLLIEHITQKKIQSVLVTQIVVMDHWLDLYINYRKHYIQKVSPFWMRFQLVRDKAPLEKSNERFDFSFEQCKRHICALNKYTHNQGYTQQLEIIASRSSNKDQKTKN